MALQGKGYYLWQVKRAFEGNPGKIAEAAQQAGLSHVLIKVADGVYNYNITNGVDMVPPLVAALRARGISPWGWQYIYGVSPGNEAKRAVQRVKQLGLDGFIVNAEGQFKAKGMDKVARTYMQELRKGLPKFPVALSTYRYPSVHQAFPFSAFLEYCDLNMPQVYWIGSKNPAQQLKKSYDEYKAIKPWRPMVPTGSAYAEGNWAPTPQQIQEFLQASRSMGLAGANFWEWQTAYLQPDVWNTVKAFSWAPAQQQPAPTPPAQPPTPAPPAQQQPTPTPPAPAPVKPNPAPAPIPVPVKPAPPDPRLQQALEIGNRLVAAYNSANPTKIAALYHGDARLICNGQGRSGPGEIYSLQIGLIRDTFPKAKFRLLDAGVYADFLKVVWSAELANGKTARGTDLIRMTVDGKQIFVHHAAFTISKSMEPALA